MEKLLKYPADIFRKGDFFFGIGLPGLIIFLAFLGLIAFTIFGYRSTRTRTNRTFRGVLIFFRSLVLIILVFCLLKPIITVPQTNPEDSYLLVLMDTGR